MKVFERLVVGAFQCNCYLVGDPVSLQGIVIDPGDDPDGILAAAERHGLTLVAAVATHAHFDHVLAAADIRERTGVPFYLHGDDLAILDLLQESGRFFLGAELPPPPEVARRYGVVRQTVHSWLRRYAEDGSAGWRTGRRGQSVDEADRMGGGIARG